jgi:hypothetical protein
MARDVSKYRRKTKMVRKLVFLAAAVGTVLAAQDPPSRVARLGYRGGAVSFEPAGVNEWGDAQINRPLTRQITVVTGGDQGQYRIYAAAAPDDFDRWAESREIPEQRIQSVRYVSPDIVGYEDLDQYGESTPDYGWVWTPRTFAAGWAPYHFGHWMWIEPWGWTWVGDEPGDLRPFITDVGRCSTNAGVGFQGRLPYVPSTRPLSSPGLASALVLEEYSQADFPVMLGGSRWVLETFSFRLIE